MTFFLVKAIEKDCAHIYMDVWYTYVFVIMYI